MDTWPIALQQHLNADDFDVQYGDTTIRSDMDIGPAKVRRRFTDAVDIYTCSIFLDLDSWSVLRDFYKTILAGGSLPFLFNDPLNGGATATFRFAKPPDGRPIGGRIFRISMTWERMP